MILDFFKRATRKITSATKNIFGFAGSIFRGNSHDLESIEAALYRADFGREITQCILDAVRKSCKSDRNLRGQEVGEIAKHVLRAGLQGAEGKFATTGYPLVICLIGVNGVGKTTTAAKLAHAFKKNGDDVLLGACDTFRAAANEQINVWAQRMAIDIVGSQHGADTAAVAYDALTAAISRRKKILILDTAGRMHTKSQLLEELSKFRRTILKKIPESQLYAWLVVDANNGSNSIAQAKIFNEVFKLNGIVITKLDGTSRGGALVGIYQELKLPIFYVGVGEQLDDLVPFSITSYIDALFSDE
ncbi:MAG: signal recognition particle-docking protein FtsY [Puniceicoccales bacterium]|jgi:fused signal recognition particle receptor|nr:signal recognition particle-docking protein FtsY [Puniceicoccales bacterium]